MSNLIVQSVGIITLKIRLAGFTPGVYTDGQTSTSISGKPICTSSWEDVDINAWTLNSKFQYNQFNDNMF